MEIKEYFEQNRHKEWKPESIPDNIWESDWPFTYLDFPEDFKVFEEEINKLPEQFWVNHRAKDKAGSYSHEGWQSSTIHGISYDKTEHFDRYGFNTQEEANYTWTEICEYIPNTVEFIKNLKYSRYDRVRLMKLQPGGYIMPHTDGNSRVFGPLNIAINNPTGCRFVFEKYGTVPFKQGRGVFPDIGNTHAVHNDSSQSRIHLILHGEINPELMSKAVTATFNGLHKRYI